MNIITIGLAVGVAALSAIHPTCVPQQGIIAAGATLKMEVEGFEFTEGPACDASGNVFFTDQPNDRILKWSVDGKLTTFMQPCGRDTSAHSDT